MFNKTASLHLTFAKIAPIAVSIPHLWGKRSHFRGALATWKAPVPLEKPGPGGALVSRCHRLPPWAAPACRPRGEFLCPPRPSLASGPGRWVEASLQAAAAALAFCICANRSASSNIHLNFPFKPLSCIIASIVLVTDKCLAINQS